MPDFRNAETVTRQRREQTGTDRYGNPTYSWVDDVLPEPAALDPGGSREPVEVGREQVVTNPKAYFRSKGVDVTSSDRLVIRGTTYQVVADPAVWVSPFTTRVGGTVVELQNVKG